MRTMGLLCLQEVLTNKTGCWWMNTTRSGLPLQRLS